MNCAYKIDKGSSESLIADAQNVFGGLAVATTLFAEAGFVEANSRQSYVYDLEGQGYLDCYTSGGMFNLGRANPELQKELVYAARELDQGNFVMVSAEKARLAKALAGFMPGSLECSLFTVVRGEAFDAACKLARGFTGRSDLVSIAGGWHGQTGFAASLAHDAGQHDYAPQLPGTMNLGFNDLSQAKEMIGNKTAAVVFEPVQAENNCRQVEKQFAQYLRRLCDAVGALMVVDETQTGFGRTGRKFAFESLGVEPDIVILGEAITGGMFPMTAMVFTSRVKEFFDEHPLIHLCTFGGHDVGCRVAVKALQLYEAQKPWVRASELGAQLKSGLERLASEYDKIIKSINGAGLLWSLQTSGSDQAEAFCKNALKHGVLALPGTVDGASVLIRPPLTIENEEIDVLVKSLNSAAAETE